MKRRCTETLKEEKNYYMLEKGGRVRKLLSEMWSKVTLITVVKINWVVKIN